MNFGKYSVIEPHELKFELEPEWSWFIRPATSGDDLSMAKFYFTNTSTKIVNGEEVDTPPLWMEVMYREIALLFAGTTIPKDPKKPNVPILDIKKNPSLEEIEKALSSMPEVMVEEIWKALGEQNPFWGPRLYQPEPSEASPSEEEVGKKK
jgi:hypothetical protein